MTIRCHNPKISKINQAAWDNARQLLRRDLADVIDLPEDLRNTVVNTYYEFCCLALELNQGPHHWPCYYRATNTPRPNDDPVAAQAKFYSEWAILMPAVKHLPEMISAIRRLKADGEMRGYKLSVSLVLDTFKYRIPGLQEKSSFRVALERPFYASKVNEIPNLWKLL
jgi:hypothetical protein